MKQQEAEQIKVILKDMAECFREFEKQMTKIYYRLENLKGGEK